MGRSWEELGEAIEYDKDTLCAQRIDKTIIVTKEKGKRRKMRAFVENRILLH